MQIDSEWESTVLLIKLDQRTGKMERRIDQLRSKILVSGEKKITWFEYNHTTVPSGNC